MIYAADRDLTESVCRHAREFFSRRDETHFVSRKNEKGRKEETCEWSLAMAMSAHKLQVFPWHNGYESAQLDYFEDYTLQDRKSTRLNSSHVAISYAVFCLKKK